MKFETAREIQNILTEKYLFANVGRLQYAGDYQEPISFSSDLENDIYESFHAIDGIGLVRVGHDDYALQLYHTSYVLYPDAVRQCFDIKESDVQYEEIEPFTFQSRVRPLRMGCSVGHILSDYCGTLGCFVQNEDGERFLLSNYHVLYNEASDYSDDFIIQPGNPGSDRENVVGLLSNKIPVDQSTINFFDAALAGPISLEIDYHIPHLAPQRIAGVTDGDYGDPVYKVGAVSEVTFGYVKSLPTNVRIRSDGVEYGFQDQILIAGTDEHSGGPALFSEPGDSGSVVINRENHMAIGLLFAGSPSGLTLANPLNGVLTSLNVSISN